MISTKELYRLYRDSKGVQTDTRKIQKGELFFALKGDNFDGNLYAQQALSKGAIGAIVDDSSLVNIKACYLVEDVLEALQQLAHHHRKQFEIPFLAITGSNGKTTTKELLWSVLSQKYNVLATKGNLNNHIGVPLTILSIKEEHDFAIIEMGANHIGEIAAYCKWTEPDYGLINNCGKAHLEGFGGIEGVRKGKGELYDAILQRGGTIFRNADYDYLKEMSSQIEKQITYGEFSGEYRAKIYEHEPLLKIATVSSGHEQVINTQLVGDYNLPNVLAAIAVGSYFGISMDLITKAISTYAPNNNRSEHRVVNGVNVILDAYNANPTSMKAALDSFGSTNSQNKTVMLGAMMELGEESEKEHEALLDYALTTSWKHIVVVGEEFELSAKERGIQYFHKVDGAKEWFWKYAKEGDWVYIKGSRLTAMEKIIET